MKITSKHRNNGSSSIRSRPPPQALQVVGKGKAERQPIAQPLNPRWNALFIKKMKHNASGVDYTKIKRHNVNDSLLNNVQNPDLVHVDKIFEERNELMKCRLNNNSATEVRLEQAKQQANLQIRSAGRTSQSGSTEKDHKMRQQDQMKARKNLQI